MGTRNFYPVEEKHSRIKWERADAESSHRLVLALGKQRRGLMGLAVWFALLFPVAILLVITVGFAYKFIQELPDIDTANLVVCILFALCIVFFSAFLLVRYRKDRPYLHPKKQSEIWVFRAKCSDISMIWSGQSNRRYSAYFQKGGIHIRIPIQWSEHNSNPKGKEYIFYKFNDRTGNRWAAIAAEELDQISVKKH